ncbi:MAG: proprotein convertase P-domain-containing protein [Phycisphaerae bacterium]|nr:proprotein convertase P-domain-containing protein [Phycisphaerae bacterium]
MSKRGTSWLCLSLILAAGTSGGMGAGMTPPARSVDGVAAQAEFLRSNPDTRFYLTSGRVTTIYGRAFSEGRSAKESADRFVRASAAVFGAHADDLLARSLRPDGQYQIGVMWDEVSESFKFTLLSYAQVRDGVPVFRGELRLLVRNEEGNPLVLARSALQDVGSFRVPAAGLLGEDAVVAAVRAVFPDLNEFTTPARVIWAGYEGAAKARLAFQTIASGPRDAQGLPRKWLVLVDAQTGELLFKENQVQSVDVTGTVTGNHTTGNTADACAAEGVTALPFAKVSITGGATVFADANGNFTIPNAGSGAVSVVSEMKGQWFTVNDQGGALDTLTQSVTPPGPVSFLHNAANSNEFVRAQVNGYKHANLVRSFVLGYNPTFPVIAAQTAFPVNVNLNSTCNAFYDGSSINFYRLGGGCNNTAYSNVVYHEYGHHLVASAGSGQGAYGEGFGDAVGVVIADDPVTGYGFQTCSTGIRTADNTKQYPCAGEIHDCGQLITGAIWSTRNELATTHPGTYLDILRPIVVNSVLLHTGTEITPQITIDFLTLDDNDANINNGTPHYNQINNGFTAHNMAGPDLHPMGVSPSGLTNHSGPVGGPFNPTSVAYTLSNNTASSISYQVSLAGGGTAPILLNGGGGPVSGSLAANGTTVITASLSPSASGLGAGLYTTTINFADLSNSETQTRQHKLDVGRIVYSSGDVPRPINDNSTVTSTLTVPDSYCIADVNVGLNITHTYIGDLEVDLTSPQGTTVRLHNHTGGSSDNIVKTYDQGVADPDGPGSLNNFNGENAQGVWTLRVADTATVDVGTLNSWSVQVAPTSGGCPTRVVVYDFPLSTDPGWSRTGQWAYGTPTGAGGDPASGKTGTKVFGYNLAGAYPNNMASTEYLRTGALNLTGRTSTKLEFWRWLGVESATYDHATVEVSNNGTTWTTLYANPASSFQDTSWTRQVFDISAVADNQATVYVRWGMGTTDSSVTYSGWNIDDVQITALQVCRVDYNGDTSVDDFDFFDFLNDFNANNSAADYNGDTSVDDFDFFDFLNDFNIGC